MDISAFLPGASAVVPILAYLYLVTPSSASTSATPLFLATTKVSTGSLEGQRDTSNIDMCILEVGELVDFIEEDIMSIANEDADRSVISDDVLVVGF